MSNIILCPRCEGNIDDPERNELCTLCKGDGVIEDKNYTEKSLPSVHSLSVGNRFRLMANLPLLPE